MDMKQIIGTPTNSVELEHLATATNLKWTQQTSYVGPTKTTFLHHPPS